MPQDAGVDALTEIKREQEVTSRPKPQATLPPELRPPAQHEFSDASYKLAAPKKSAAKSKPDMSKSLDWAAQQRKTAEDTLKEVGGGTEPK